MPKPIDMTAEEAEEVLDNHLIAALTRLASATVEVWRCDGTPAVVDAVLAKCELRTEADALRQNLTILRSVDYVRCPLTIHVPGTDLVLRVAE